MRFSFEWGLFEDTQHYILQCTTSNIWDSIDTFTNTCDFCIFEPYTTPFFLSSSSYEKGRCIDGGQGPSHDD